MELNYAFIIALLLAASWEFVAAFGTPAFVSTTRSKSYRSTHNSGVDSTTRLYADKKQNEDTSSLSINKKSPQDDSSPKLVAKPNHQTKDIVIIGGGLAGLSVALYVSQMAPDRHVTILEREDLQKETTTVASMAAAGMLAPQSERLPKGPLLDLCLASRRLYPDFCNLVETLASQDEVSDYLIRNDDESSEKLKPHSVGYVASGGFLAPAFAGDSVATWAPPDDAGTATWLDATQVRELEPNLHPKVVGGWWFPEDASVDSRRLTHSLRAACVAAGVQLSTGSHYEVSSLDLEDGKCRGLWLKSGKYISAKSVLVANGAWMRTLLPVPIEPHKGQSLSLRMPPNQPPLLRRVLFAQDSYIVPKADGRIVVGATVEAGSFDPHVTPAGLLHILGHALELVPGLADLPMEETWVGLRPTTPDKGPILGKSPWENLYLAGGYWRNGVLLAPKTGQLLAALLADLELNSDDVDLLDAFSWDRFTSAEGGKALAASARYAASMHPIHQRTTGVGVAASVGTELGVYSDATSAAQEREQDRKALWDTDGTEDDAFERAAQMGKSDFDAFIFDEDDDNDTPTAEPQKKKKEYVASLNPAVTTPFEGSADAITVHGYSETEQQPQKESTIPPKINGEGDSILDGYQAIQGDAEAARKARQAARSGMTSVGDDDDTSKDAEIMEDDDEFWPSSDAQYTTESSSAIDETESKQNEKQKEPQPSKDLSEIYGQIKKNKQEKPEMSESDTAERPDPGFRIYRVDEETGKSYEVPPYTTPQEMTELIAKMKQDREKDEAASTEQPLKKSSSTEESERTEESFESKQDESKDTQSSELSEVYNQIKKNKQQQQQLEMSESNSEARPDPGFRIYRVDEETGKSYEVPPYTTPQEMTELIAKTKQDETEETTTTEALESSEEESLERKDTPQAPPSTQEEEYNEQTFDGYTAIQQANARASREEELQAMKDARKKNRMSASEIKMEDIGAQREQQT